MLQMEPASGTDPTQFESCKLNYPACSSVCDAEEHRKLNLSTFIGLFPSVKKEKNNFSIFF